MPTISVVISAWNEEAKIARCLASVSWATEIIVVDNASTDKTAAIAKKHKATVYKRVNNPMLNVNKNYGFSRATSEWILNLDADEEVTPALATEIQQTIESGHAEGYWIPRKNIIFGKWIQHGLWWPDKQLRLFRNGKGKFPEKHIHEYITVEGEVGTLNEPYIHHNYETISQFLRKMDTLYTENEVANHIASGYQLAWYDALRFPISDFVKIFFAQEGYKDGLHGLVLSILQALYSFVVFAKLWERTSFAKKDVTLHAVTEELADRGRELAYWSVTSKIKESHNPITTVLLKARRKFLS